MEPPSPSAEVVQFAKAALALVTGVLGWLVKDYFLGIVAKRREVVRAEWKARLTEVWGPLFYWSGAVRMDGGKKGWDRHGVRELEDLVKGNVHLIPQRHFFTLIRLVEAATGQSTSGIDEKAYSQARKFIYQRIEILNFLLYRQTREYDPDAYTDPLALPRALLRALTLVFVHGVVWVLILAVPCGIYFAWVRSVHSVLWVIGALLATGAIVEFRRRSAVHRAVMVALYPDQALTWKALLGRLWRSVFPARPSSGGQPPHPTPSRRSGTVQRATAEVQRVTKAAGNSSRTVAEIWAQRAALNKKKVTIRGKVFKFNERIMGKNWIHLRDGSGISGKDNDLTVTTTDQATVGETVTVVGTVSVAKDFGAGYAYPVIVEDAKVSR